MIYLIIIFITELIEHNLLTEHNIYGENRYSGKQIRFNSELSVYVCLFVKYRFYLIIHSLYIHIRISIQLKINIAVLNKFFLTRNKYL